MVSKNFFQSCIVCKLYTLCKYSICTEYSDDIPDHTFTISHTHDIPNLYDFPPWNTQDYIFLKAI